MHRRQKERKLQFRKFISSECSSKSIGSNPPTVKPSYFIKTLLEINPSDVAALVRVSGKTQKYKGNLDRQETFVVDAIAKAGIKIAEMFTHQGSAKLSIFKKTLINIFRKMQKKGIKYLVAATLSRLIRSESFDSIHNPDAEPTSEELKALKELAEEYGIQLLTIADPDLSLGQDRTFLAKSSQKVNGRESISKKQAFREVEELKRKYDWSCRRIAKFISGKGYRVSYRTVSRWLK